MGRELWVTDRCLRADLRLTFSDEAHPLIAKFVLLRSQVAEPVGDHISKTRPRTLYKLDATKHGRVWRGATWHDRANDVVFLVAAGWHRSGARDDFYAGLVRRLAAVYPSDPDLAQLRLAAAEREARDFRERVIPEWLEVARSQGVVVRWTKHCRVRIEAGPNLDVVALKLDPRPGEQLDIRVAVTTAVLFARAIGRPLVRSDQQWGKSRLSAGSYVFYI